MAQKVSNLNFLRFSKTYPYRILGPGIFRPRMMPLAVQVYGLSKHNLKVSCPISLLFK